MCVRKVIMAEETQQMGWGSLLSNREDSLLLTFVLVISWSQCAEGGMRIHSHSCCCYWQCKTACLLTLKYRSCCCVLKNISSDREMINCLHLVMRWLGGRVDSVISVTRWRINMISETRCRRRPLARAMLHNQERKSMEMLLFLCEKGLQWPAIIFFNVHCILWEMDIQ